MVVKRPSYAREGGRGAGREGVLGGCVDLHEGETEVGKLDSKDNVRGKGLAPQTLLIDSHNATEEGAQQQPGQDELRDLCSCVCRGGL